MGEQTQFQWKENDDGTTTLRVKMEFTIPKGPIARGMVSEIKRGLNNAADGVRIMLDEVASGKEDG